MLFRPLSDPNTDRRLFPLTQFNIEGGMSRLSKVSCLGVVTIFTAGLVAVLPTPSTLVEQLYSRGIYLAAQNVLTPLASLAPFALFDFLLGTVVIGVVVYWVTRMQGVVRGHRLRIFLIIVFNTTALVAGIYLAFLLVWGLNYRREPLTTKLDYQSDQVTNQSLTELAAYSVGRLNQLHASAHQSGWSTLEELPSRFSQAFEQAQRGLGSSRVAVAGVPKQTLLQPYFRRAGIDGMLSPFSLEILINDAILPFERPYVVAHEWAHLAGFADESEASFVGWLTCLYGDDSSRYSAWLFLAPRVFRHLKESERSRLWAQMDETPTTDLRAVAQRMRGAVPVVQRNANRVYNQYLRANRVEAGIASYGEVVDLILGTGAWKARKR